jgi:hypothetical protein
MPGKLDLEKPKFSLRRTYNRRPRLSAAELDKLGLDDLLKNSLGAARFERAKTIPDDLVSLSSVGPNHRLRTRVVAS